MPAYPQGSEAMIASVVDELILHNLNCSQCRAGEPCLVAEHIQDCWPRRVGPQAAASLLEITANAENERVAPIKISVPQYSRV
jgi:hypothetical protein